MSRFPDLAALKKLVAASALETKRKKHETQSPLVLPHHQHWLNSSLSCREQNYTDQAAKAEARKVTVGQAEVPQTRQEKEGLGAALKMKSIQMMGQKV